MSYDHFGVIRVKSQEFNGLFGYETMRGSVETVFADFVFVIIFVRDCIHVCFFRHSLMESGVEYSYVWFARHQLHTCTDTH